ncbi:MAG: NAD(P)(+) transhydrogenase (Re/Si-specific) subunit beta, partial [Alphaproteobacteria bacterium]|nr:NAD(P)(+) transhydrogenase (Re/Si-specific) subunit beta [Alphaproteobacteria bacterium]
MPATLTTVSYIGAIILFILSLGGLSNPETSRRGNWYGVIGMTIAVLATIFGTRLVDVGAGVFEQWRLVMPSGLVWIVAAMAVGGTIGIIASRIVRMTQMPELVAIMHSLVGLAACT